MTAQQKLAALRTTRFIVAAVTILLVVAGSAAIMVSLSLPWQPEAAGSALDGGATRPALPGSLLFFSGLSILALAAFFGMLWRIAGTVVGGDPFIPANATRLFWTGWIALAHWIFGIAGNLAGASYRGNPGLLDWNFTPLALAICLFIIAKVFKHGTSLRDDLEGTV